MKALLQRFIHSATIAVIPVVTLCYFATLSIYSGNATEFTVSFSDVAIHYLPYALGAVVALGLLGLLMTKEGLSRYKAIMCAFAILFWLQGNILVWDYGILDGRDIEWMADAWRGIFDVAIWSAVLLVAICAFQRFGKILLLSAVATMVIQFVATGATLLGNPDMLMARDIASNTEGKDAISRFSATNNIVHIVMDGFQSDIFAAIIADTSERNFKADLRGFTYFDEHLGVYPYTHLTVAAMLSGKLFHNNVPVEEFIRDTMRDETIINASLAAGYEVDIAASVGLKNMYTKGSYSNAYGISSNGHVDIADYVRVDAAKLIDLALFRSVPHFAKALVYRDELWVFQALVHGESYLSMQYFSDLAFLSDLAENMSADRDVPVYKMIHVMLSHRPFVGNARCEFDGRKPTKRKYVQTHARCGLVRVLNVLQRMKELGIYDSSLIVLMADHGAWVPVENFAKSDVVNATTVAMATPMLAIKPPNANYEFRTSSVLSSIVDLPATIADIAGLDGQFGGTPVYSIAVDAPRQRHHLVYGYGINPDAEGFLFPMQEYLINGSAYDVGAWRKGQRYLPGTMLDSTANIGR